MENRLTEEYLHRLIQERAYEIYQERGQVEGSHLADWDQAESEIVASLGAINTEGRESASPEIEDTALNLTRLKRAKAGRA